MCSLDRLTCHEYTSFVRNAQIISNWSSDFSNREGKKKCSLPTRRDFLRHLWLFFTCHFLSQINLYEKKKEIHLLLVYVNNKLIERKSVNIRSLVNYRIYRHCRRCIYLDALAHSMHRKSDLSVVQLRST